MASGKIDSLWVELGVKGVGQGTLTDFIQGLGAIKMGSLAAGGALGSLMGMVAESTRAAVSFQTFSNATALSTDQLQLWQNAATLANDSADSMTAAITTLQQRLQAIKMGKFDPAFFKLGDVPGKPSDTFDVLRKVMARRGTMPTADYSAVVSELGLGGIQNTLARGERGLSGANKIDRMSREQIDANLEFMLKFKTLWLEVRDISRDVGSAIAGEGSGVLDTLSEAAQGINEALHIATGVNKNTPWLMRGPKGLPIPNFSKFVDPKAMERLRGVVTVNITGDRENAFLSKQVAEEVAKIAGLTADQIMVESNDNNTIPGIPKAK